MSSNYGFTMEISEIQLYNNLAYQSVDESSVLTKAQISNMISDTVFTIVDTSPETVNTMAEVSTFFSQTDSEIWSTIVYEYADGNTKYTDERSDVLSTITANDADMDLKTTSLSNNASTEFANAFHDNDSASNAISTELSNTLANDNHLSTETSTHLADNLSERLALSDILEERFSNASHFQDVYSDGLSTNVSGIIVDISNNSDNLSTETVRAVSSEQWLSTELSSIAKNEDHRHAQNSNSLSNHESTNDVISDALSTNLASQQGSAQGDDTAIKDELHTHSTDLSNDVSTLSAAMSSHLQTYTDLHNTLSTDLSTTSTENSSYLANYTHDSIEESDRKSTELSEMSVEFSSNFSTNLNNLDLRMNITGGVAHRHLNIEGALYLGPYWRIREESSNNSIVFEYYDTSAHQWRVSIPFFKPANM